MRLGIDIGTNSIGWWLYDTSDGRITGVLDGGVRIFSNGRKPKSGTSLAVDRRTARAMRRRRDRYLRRRASLMKQLAEAGLMPADPKEAKRLEELDPYSLRAEALDRPLPLTHLGRALFHLNQRRGFRSNRKTDRLDNKSGLIKEGTARLDQAMMTLGARTYGEFLDLRRRTATTEHQVPPVRTRLTSAVRGGEEKEKAGYDYYPDRRHLQEEFEEIWSAQEPHYPDVLSTNLRDAIYQTIFYQRPLKEPAVGRCLFTGERRLPKSHPLAARRVLFETVNALKVKFQGEQTRPLTLEERDIIISVIDHRRHTKSIAGMKLTLTALATAINLRPEERFTLETVNRDAIACDPVRASLSHPDRFGSRWAGMTWEDQWKIIDRLRREESNLKLVNWLVAEYSLKQDRAEAVAAAPIPDGYSRIGETATHSILEALKSDVLTYSEAVEVCGWHHSDHRAGEMFAALPYYGQVLDRHVIPGTQDPNDDEITRYGRITNPTVHIGLNQMRRLINRIIRVYGKPDQIVVELAREIKKSKEQKDKDQRRLNETTNAAIERGNKLTELERPNNGQNRMLLRLWEELGRDVLVRRCPYSGLQVSPKMLFDGSCDVDHILPYSRTLDDSPSNRIVCIREANRAKGNRTPWEAWGGTEHWPTIVANLNSLPNNKRWRFAPDAMIRFEKDRDFLDRALVDTQYLGRLTRLYLEALYPDSKQHVWVVPGRLTEMLRRHWGLNSLLTDQDRGANKSKNRTDHRHHAVDAAVIAATDRSLLKRISDAARRLEEMGAEDVARTTKVPWPSFRSDIELQLGKIIVSHRSDHGRIDVNARRVGHDSTAAKLHNDTAYGLTGMQKNDIPMVVTRKSLNDLKPGQLDSVRDVYLQQCLKAATQGKTATEFKDSLVSFAREPGAYQGMRRVRLIEPIKVVEVKDSSGRAYKGFKPDSNFCYELWEMPDGRWVPVVYTTFEAHQSQFALRPHPAAKKIMRLHKRDMIALTHPEHGELIATIAQLSIQRLDLVAHYEANADARNRDSTDPFSFIRVGATTLKKSGARRVYVDEMGRLRDPGPIGMD